MMTKDEAIIHGKEQLDVFGGEHREFIELAIKVMEQDAILDKIRAEIMDWQIDIHDNEYDAKSHDFVFERIYEIIDKYKESEG